MNNRRSSGLFKKKASVDSLVVSAPSVASSSSSSQSFPEDLEAQFLVAAKKVGLPLASAQSLSQEKKWQIVQEMQKTALIKETEESFLKRVDLMMSTKKLAVPTPADTFASSSISWLESLVAKGGGIKLTRLLGVFLSTGDDEAVGDCMRAIRSICDFESGINVLATDPIGVQHMIRSMFRVNVLQKVTIVHMLCSITASTGFLVLNSCLEQKPVDGGSPYYIRIGELLVSCENSDLRSAIVLLLITMLKQADLLSLRPRFLSTLAKYDVHQLLSDLLATQTSDAQLVELISRFQSMCGSFFSDQAAVPVSAANDSNALVRSLLAAAKVSGRSEVLQSILRHLELLEKAGEVGKAVWDHMDAFIKLAASTPVKGNADAWFSEVLSLANHEEVASPSAPAQAAASASQAELIEKLTRKVDELSISLQLALEQSAKAAAEINQVASQKLIKQEEAATKASVTPPGAAAPPDDALPGPAAPAPPPPPAPPSLSGEGGGAPPPPPPPGAPAPSAAKKPHVISKTKLRCVTWSTVSGGASGTVFDGVNDFLLQEKIAASESIVGLFADKRKATPMKEMAPVASTTASLVVADDSFVDPKRSNNITIMLSRFKSVPLSELRDRVMSCSLSLDDALLLQPHLPTLEESAVLGSLDGPSRLALGRVENFLLQMFSVPRVANRFVCIICNSTLEERLASTGSSVRLLKDAFVALRSSTRLKSFFSYCLALGNFVNQSSFRGGAHGFRLESLQDFLSTKTNEPTISVLDVLVDVIKQRDPGVLEGLVAELAAVSAAVEREDGSQLVSDVAALNSDVQLCQNENEVGDATLQKMLGPLLQRALPLLEKLKTDVEDMKKEFSAATKYLASEDTKISESSIFLRRIDFLSKGLIAKERLAKLQREKKK